MQYWHIQAEDVRLGEGFVEFDLSEHTVRQLICMMIKSKRNKRLGKVWLEVFCETNPNSKDWCEEEGLKWGYKKTK